MEKKEILLGRRTLFLEGGHFSQKSPVICSSLIEPGFVTCSFWSNQNKRIPPRTIRSSFKPRVSSALQEHGEIMVPEENHVSVRKKEREMDPVGKIRVYYT